MELTPRQREIYEYIKQRINSGVVPSVREMMKAFDITAPNGILCHLKALRKKGWIDWEPKASRSIRLLKELRPGELRDLQGSVHSFGDLFAEGNWAIGTAFGYAIYRGQKVLGQIRRVK